VCVKLIVCLPVCVVYGFATWSKMKICFSIIDTEFCHYTKGREQVNPTLSSMQQKLKHKFVGQDKWQKINIYIDKSASVINYQNMNTFVSCVKWILEGFLDYVVYKTSCGNLVILWCNYLQVYLNYKKTQLNNMVRKPNYG
jgi:hypothetical protein